MMDCIAWSAAKVAGCDGNASPAGGNGFGIGNLSSYNALAERFLMVAGERLNARDAIPGGRAGLRVGILLVEEYVAALEGHTRHTLRGGDPEEVVGARAFEIEAFKVVWRRLLDLHGDATQQHRAFGALQANSGEEHRHIPRSR
jgi:hypothetical protein